MNEFNHQIFPAQMCFKDQKKPLQTTEVVGNLQKVTGFSEVPMFIGLEVRSVQCGGDGDDA